MPSLMRKLSRCRCLPSTGRGACQLAGASEVDLQPAQRQHWEIARQWTRPATRRSRLNLRYPQSLHITLARGETASPLSLYAMSCAGWTGRGGSPGLGGGPGRGCGPGRVGWAGSGGPQRACSEVQCSASELAELYKYYPKPCVFGRMGSVTNC
jgi:hypothetical protein